MKWINTERATIERAQELLAAQLPGIPIWIRWYKTFDGGNNGNAWGTTRMYVTCELVGVTAKRLTVKENSSIVHANPARCYFATREQTPATAPQAKASEPAADRFAEVLASWLK